MRLTSDSTIAAMSKDQLTKRLNTTCDGRSEEELRDLLHQSERRRSLCLWHDHATLLKTGFVLVTIHIMYDSLVFYTQEEYEELHLGADVSVQAEVEQPEFTCLRLVPLALKTRQHSLVIGSLASLILPHQ